MKMETIDIEELGRLATEASRAAQSHWGYKAAIDEFLAELAFYSLPALMKVIEQQQADIENLQTQILLMAQRSK